MLAGRRVIFTGKKIQLNTTKSNISRRRKRRNDLNYSLTTNTHMRLRGALAEASGQYCLVSATSKRRLIDILPQPL